MDSPNKQVRSSDAKPKLLSLSNTQQKNRNGRLDKKCSLQLSVGITIFGMLQCKLKNMVRCHVLWPITNNTMCTYTDSYY